MSEMAERCSVAGVVFQPMHFENLGGSTAAERVIKSLNRMVAENEHTPSVELAVRFWQRLYIDVQKVGHKAFSRRGLEGKIWRERRLVGFQGPGHF